MSDLGARMLGLATRLATHALRTSAPPADRPAVEGVYREALRRWFELTAQGPAADQAEVARVHQEILRLIDEVGEPKATALRRQWAREWWDKTGVCPFCGERGQYHDPEHGAGLLEP
ncbi:MAG: hypothetical protein ACE5NC_10855 [Anaerolineae bacterium]